MRIAAAIAAFAATLTVPASADFTRSWPESPTNLKCDIGPTERIIAEDVWLLYACDDEASLVFVAPNGDPAPPSYFALLLDLNGRYRILRQVIADRAASQAAYRELKSWSANDIVAARRESTAASKPVRPEPVALGAVFDSEGRLPNRTGFDKPSTIELNI